MIWLAESFLGEHSDSNHLISDYNISDVFSIVSGILYENM